MSSVLEVQVREMLAQVDQVLAAHETAQRAAAEAAVELNLESGVGGGGGLNDPYNDRGR